MDVELVQSLNDKNSEWEMLQSHTFWQLLLYVQVPESL